MSGSSIPRLWSALVPVRQSNAQTWPVGPNTVTAQAIPASSGACACTWSRPCTASPSGTRSPAPKPTNAKSCSTCATTTPPLAASRPGQILLGDKNYFGRDFEATIADQGIQLLRRARKGEPERAGGRFFKPLRQTVESIFDTLKGQLDLEQHGGHTPQGVLVRVLQRLLAMTTAIWHNDRTGQPVRRSLLAYDH